MNSDEPSEIGAELLGDLADEEGVRKLIECPICLEIPLPPIYLCAKGHIVCNSCQSRTYACPLCRERYCNTRSFVAEGIVEKCHLRCRYAEGGCKISMKGAELGDHLSICEFRPVNCRECGDKPINYSDYEQHLFKDHNLSGTIGNEAFVAYRINLNFMQRSLGVDTCFWPQYYIKAFDKIFLLRLNAHQFSINPWVCLLGSQSECDKYTVLIEYEPCNDGAIVHSWKGPVNHFRDDPVVVIAQGKALSVPMDTIMESGAISTDRAEWIYHIMLYEKCLSNDLFDVTSPCDEETCTVTETKDSSSLEQCLTETVKKQSKDGDLESPMSLPSGPSSAAVAVDEELSSSISVPHRSVHRNGNVTATSSKGQSHSLPSLASNKNGGGGVSVGVRAIDRRPKCTIQPLTKNIRIMESAGRNLGSGNQGDIDDTSDFDWEL